MCTRPMPDASSSASAMSTEAAMLWRKPGGIGSPPMWPGNVAASTSCRCSSAGKNRLPRLGVESERMKEKERLPGAAVMSDGGAEDHRAHFREKVIIPTITAREGRRCLGL